MVVRRCRCRAPPGDPGRHLGEPSGPSGDRSSSSIWGREPPSSCCQCTPLPTHQGTHTLNSWELVVFRNDNNENPVFRHASLSSTHPCYEHRSVAVLIKYFKTRNPYILRAAWHAVHVERRCNKGWCQRKYNRLSTSYQICNTEFQKFSQKEILQNWVFSQTCTPTCQYFYTGISVISVIFCNSAPPGPLTFLSWRFKLLFIFLSWKFSNF